MLKKAQPEKEAQEEEKTRQSNKEKTPLLKAKQLNCLKNWVEVFPNRVKALLLQKLPLTKTNLTNDYYHSSKACILLGEVKKSQKVSPTQAYEFVRNAREENG